MGRPTVYGKEIVMDSGEFVGINLGYNFYTEHEHGTGKIVLNNWNGLREHITKSSVYGMMFWRCPYVTGCTTVRQATKQAKRLQKEALEKEARWKDTPFANNMLPCCTPYMKREIVINNASIKDQHDTFQTTDGIYILLRIGEDGLEWDKYHGNASFFTEDELQYMNDYQGRAKMNNFGLGLAQFMGNAPQSGNPDFAASWSNNDNVIQIIFPKQLEHIADSIVETLKAGNLAVTYGEKMNYKDRGLCLTDLEAVYRMEDAVHENEIMCGHVTFTQEDN